MKGGARCLRQRVTDVLRSVSAAGARHVVVA